MKRYPVIFLLLLVALALSAADGWGEFRFMKNGAIRFGEIEFQSAVMFGTKWLSVSIANPERKETPTEIDFRASLQVPGEDMTGEYSYRCTPAGENAIAFAGKLGFPKPLPINSAHLGFSVPLGTLVRADGADIPLPESYKEITVARKACKQMKLVIPGGRVIELTGDFTMLIQDMRAFNNNTFQIRILYGRRSTLELTIAAYAVRSQVVDITPAANRGFSDDAADDGKGGWTDQGPGNDLRMVPAGTMNYDRIPFRVVDEKKFPGKSVIAVAGTARSFHVPEIALALPENNAKAISLLHASAWTTPAVGELLVAYADGSEQKIPVLGSRECSNWVDPHNQSNGYVLWRGYNTQNTAGLYVSSFRLNGEKPRRLTFRIADPQAIWLIAGVTLNAEFSPVQFLQDQEVIVREGSEWTRLDFESRIPADSALDFSFLLDPPAGKYGRIVAAPNGNLVFEQRPDRRVRLWGENICQYALRHDKPTFQSLAEYFARMGINFVRLHHHDNDLADPSAPDSTTLNLKHLDNLEYFVAELKKNGIYITTDLFTSRKLKPGDNIPELAGMKETGSAFKTLIPFSDAAFNNWKTFAKNWITHRNPYTGLTWAEDPALVFINLVNEDNLSVQWDRSGLAPLVQSKFDEWTKKTGLPQSRISNSDRNFRRFLDETHTACYRKMMAFLHNECGVKAMMTSQNFYADVPVTILRNQFDLVDDHMYAGHPSTWGLPQGYSQGCAIRSMGGIARQLAAGRIWNKPFSITEFSFPAPTVTRAEWGPLMGGYAAFQDWNALTRFAYGFSTVNSTPRKLINDFENANEPMAQFSDRIFAAMFLRGDVASAPGKVALRLPADFYATTNADRGFPGEFLMLGLITGIGDVIGDATLPPEAKLYPEIDPETRKRLERALKDRVAVSSTDELFLDGNKETLRVDTPRTQTVTLPKGEAATSLLKVKNANTFSTVAAVSLDGKPLRESASIVLFHLTDVCNSDIRFSNAQKTLLLHKGGLPLLVRRGRADVALTLGHPFKVTALNCDGAPKGELPVRFENGELSFQVKTDLVPGGIMVYHLTR